MILIIPAAILTFAASRAFFMAGYEDHWRRLTAIIFGLTFPGWIMLMHTLTYFGLAAAGLREWNISKQNLVLQEHLALTAAATGVFSALFLGWLAKSWFLLAVGMFSAAVLGVLTWLGEWSTLIGVAFWLAAAVISLKAWGLERRRVLLRESGAGLAPRPRSGVAPGPNGAHPYTDPTVGD